MSRLLYIVGAGGHGREVAWLAGRCSRPVADTRFLVERQYFAPGFVQDVSVSVLEDEVFVAGNEYVIAIGDPAARQRIAGQLQATGLVATTLVDPSALYSPTARIQEGAVVCAGVVMPGNVSLGRHVHVNVGCSLHHDTEVGSFTTISPGVRIAGHVRVGAGVFIGIGASIINGSAGSPLEIGDGAIIAAGACVTRSVKPNSLVAGVPATWRRHV